MVNDTGKMDNQNHKVQDCLDQLLSKRLSPLDQLPLVDIREKLIELVLYGEPKNSDSEIAELFTTLRQTLRRKRVDDVRVVVFGGGSGLSNIIGGDCRQKNWQSAPFSGLKELFPNTRSIVCVTDDGGSTGELLKDLPFIALGDIRHVLLSSIQLSKLQVRYDLTVAEAHEVVVNLSRLFNFRFVEKPVSLSSLLDDCRLDLTELPAVMRETLDAYLQRIFDDERLNPTLQRPNCLGNLIVASAIYNELDSTLTNDDLALCHDDVQQALFSGLNRISQILGGEERAVLPCTSTPSKLRVLYTNGVQVTGEYKSGFARRGYPIDRVCVDFCGQPHVYSQILADIQEADILIMAPGSLYSSIIPIFQVPGLADAVRGNKHALKMLVSNLWVQAGETDQSLTDPDRKFHVSDMLQAYGRNIPGGTRGLFDEVLCLSLKDVPASVLQRYDIEGKLPIYLDREQVKNLGFSPVECGIFSQDALAEQGVIKHDPAIIARAVKTIYVAAQSFHAVENKENESVLLPSHDEKMIPARQKSSLPSQRYKKIKQLIADLSINFQGQIGSEYAKKEIRQQLVNFVWAHCDISLHHLDYVAGLLFVDKKNWRRDQKWDNVFSFYDPDDKLIKIRIDLLGDQNKFEGAFLVALGESLLGNYAAVKAVEPIDTDGVHLGKVYHLHIVPHDQRLCYFNDESLCNYLVLARMVRNPRDANHFTRLINGDEGFTPPGLLMGLIYAWYLENRFATNIEYKMSVLQIKHSDLIPEQIKMLSRRQKIISFFREVIFS